MGRERFLSLISTTEIGANRGERRRQKREKTKQMRAAYNQGEITLTPLGMEELLRQGVYFSGVKFGSPEKMVDVFLDGLIRKVIDKHSISEDKYTVTDCCIRLAWQYHWQYHCYVVSVEGQTSSFDTLPFLRAFDLFHQFQRDVMSYEEWRGDIMGDASNSASYHFAIQREKDEIVRKMVRRALKRVVDNCRENPDDTDDSVRSTQDAEGNRVPNFVYNREHSMMLHRNLATALESHTRDESCTSVEFEPDRSRKITNEALATALLQKTEFEPEEFAAFDVKLWGTSGLKNELHGYIKSGGAYFRPLKQVPVCCGLEPLRVRAVINEFADDKTLVIKSTGVYADKHARATKWAVPLEARIATILRLWKSVVTVPIVPPATVATAPPPLFLPPPEGKKRKMKWVDMGHQLSKKTK